MKKFWLVAVVTAFGAAGDGRPQGKAPEVPGPEHQALTKLAGEYTTASRFRLKPGDPAQESKGTAKLTSVLGGRFLADESAGEQFGQPFTSWKLYGYNATAKRYEATWAYTGSTALMTLTGASGDGGRTIKFDAAVEQGGGAKMSLGVTLKVLDADHFAVE